MQIIFTGDDADLMNAVAADLANDLTIIGLDQNLQIANIRHQTLSDPAQSSNPITLTTIMLAATRSGGSLTVAMSKESFLNRLVQMLEKYVERRIEVAIDHGAGRRTRLNGPPGQIRKLLEENQTRFGDG